MDPANNSPVVAWLASEDCDITGRVIEIEGGQICVEEGWRHGPRQDIGRRWEAGEVAHAVARADRPGRRRRTRSTGEPETLPDVGPIGTVRAANGVRSPRRSRRGA